MDVETLIDLSRLLRERHSLCTQKLSRAQAAFTSQDYDDIFWGEPGDWPETESAEQRTIANLLYLPLETPREAIPKQRPCDYPRVFASFLDGCYTIRRRAGELTDWETLEHFTPFDESTFQRKLSVYTDNAPEQARWIIVGGSSALGQMPRKCHGKLLIPRSPCMCGVSIHADLTWDALSLHIHQKRNPQEVSLRLGRWGLSAYLRSVNELFLIEENAENIKKILAEKESQQMISEDGLVSVLPRELQMRSYVKRLCHLLPYAPDASVRLTGWFSSLLLEDEVTEWLSPRFKDITLYYPYMYWSYE